MSYYILHRRAREDSILHRLAKGATDIPTIVRAIYIGIDPRLTGAAGMSVLGLRALALESRRAAEMEQLIRKQEGEPFVAPTMSHVIMPPTV